MLVLCKPKIRSRVVVWWLLTAALCFSKILKSDAIFLSTLPIRAQLVEFETREHYVMEFEKFGGSFDSNNNNNGRTNSTVPTIYKLGIAKLSWEIIINILKVKSIRFCAKNNIIIQRQFSNKLCTV